MLKILMGGMLGVLSLIIPFSMCYGQESTQPQNEPTQEVQNSQPVVKQFGDWFYRCIDVATGEAAKSVKQCEVAQIQQVQQGEQTITVLSVGIAMTAPEKKGGKPGLIMTSVAPLNVFLPEGLRYSIGGKDVIKTVYNNCNQAGCWARQVLDSKMLDQLKEGNEGEGHFRLADGRNVNIKFSLKGLSAALAALEKGDGA